MTKQNDIKKAAALIIAEALKQTEHEKPVVRTMINTTALVFTTFGANLVYQGEYKWAMVLVAFGFGLELIKYMGMKVKLW